MIFNEEWETTRIALDEDQNRRRTAGLAWAATAGLSLLPAAAQTPKSAQHDPSLGCSASLLATLQKDLQAD
jgi:hypothetical protein